MIESLYSEFESDITITAKKTKTFDESEISWNELQQLNGIKSLSKGMEEVVVLRHEKKWINATLVGAESAFLKSIKIKNHALYGKPFFEEKNGLSYGIIGVELMEKLKLNLSKSQFMLQNATLKLVLVKPPFIVIKLRSPAQ